MGSKARSSFNTSRIDHLYQDPHESDPRLVLHYGDLTDSTNLIRIIRQVAVRSTLGAQNHVCVLRVRSTPPTAMHWELYGSWRRCGSGTHQHGSTGRVPVALWPGAGDPSEGEHTLLSTELRRCEALCPRITVNRESWVCLYGGAVQPRESAAGGNVCDAQDHARSGAGGCWARRVSFCGNLVRCATGAMRLRGDAVADAAAGAA